MAKRRVTVTTIADALRCARKVKSGRACTMQELRATVMLLEQGMKTAQRTTKELRDRNFFMERLMDKLGRN